MRTQIIERLPMRPITAERVGPPTPRRQPDEPMPVGMIGDLPEHMQEEIAVFHDSGEQPQVSSGVLTFLAGMVTGGAMTAIILALVGLL